MFLRQTRLKPLSLLLVAFFGITVVALLNTTVDIGVLGTFAAGFALFIVGAEMLRQALFAKNFSEVADAGGDTVTVPGHRWVNNLFFAGFLNLKVQAMLVLKVLMVLPVLLMQMVQNVVGNFICKVREKVAALKLNRLRVANAAVIARLKTIKTNWQKNVAGTSPLNAMGFNNGSFAT